MQFNILSINGVDIVPYFEAPFFIEKNFQEGKKLLGYDFIIHIPTIGTMPSMDFSADLSDYIGTEEEKISKTLHTICDLEKLTLFLSQTNPRDDLNIFFQEGLKYLNKDYSIAIAGIEFIYNA